MSKKKYLTLTFKFIFKRENMLESLACWNSPKIVNKVIDVLQSDGILIAPSDTVLGLFSRANKDGLQKLNKLKERQEKPYLILIEKFSDLNLFADLSDKPKVIKFLQKVWPGPVTIILSAKQGIELFLQSSTGTVALRLPMHNELHKVMQEVGPLFSTSANKAGELIPQSYEELDDDLVAQVDLVLCDEQVEKTRVQSSTIVDFTQEKPVVIRLGSNVARVEQVIDQLW